MTDPLDALRAPIVPAHPDPTFAEDLRDRLRRAVLGQTGADMTRTHEPTMIPAERLGWPPTISPYIAVRDGRAAIAWYLEVFGGHQRGEAMVMEDGRIGHAELGIGDAVLMLSEGDWEEVPVRVPQSPTTFSTSLHIQVGDVDGAVRRARDLGASIEREPADYPYGRTATLVDPFGHRWLLNSPPASASRHNAGDISYVTMVVRDAEKAKAFYGTVLGWTFEAGAAENGWGVPGMDDFGIWGDRSQTPEVQLCYRVADLDAAADRVAAAGGTVIGVERKPYGRMAECADDQGARFQLWQP